MTDEADLATVEGEQRTPEIEIQARELGWVPKEEFRGDPEKWVDANSYLEYGEKLLPLVRATNARLKDDIARTQRENEALRRANAETQESVKALQEYHAEELRQQRERVRKETLDRIKEARSENNVDEEVRLTGELSKIDAETAAAATRPAAKSNGSGSAATQPEVPPEVVEWQRKNPWYGTDLAKTSIAQGVAQQLRQQDPNLKGMAFLEKVTEGTNKELARLGVTQPARKDDKVESGRGGAGGGGGGNSGPAGKSYMDLPADAKAQCDKDAGDPRLVGPNRVYKDVAAFRKQWAAKYFED